MPYLSFLLCCFIWGGSFILMDRATHAFGPVEIALARMASGAAVVAVYCQLRHQWVRISARDLAHLAVVSLLANVWPYVIQPYAMRQAGEHGFFGMFVAFVPLATIVASIPMLRVYPSARQLVGVVGGLACMALVMWDGSHRGMPNWLLALAVSTPISYAVGNTYIKWKLDHLPAAPLTAIFLALGALFVLPLQLAPQLLARLQLGPPAPRHDVLLGAVSLATLGALGTGACILAFVHLVKTHGPLFAGMVTYVIPLIALAWGQVDAERLSALQIIAIVGVLAMVALVQWKSTASATALLHPTAEPPA